MQEFDAGKIARKRGKGHYTPIVWAVCFLLAASGMSSALAQTDDTKRRIRNVTPDNIPVIVLPPREKQQGDPRNRLEEIRGERVVAEVTEDGAIVVNGRTLRPAGLSFLPTDALCASPTHGRWACGLRAYVALRNFVHGKELKCETLAERPDGTLARCYRERNNIAQWLLAEGWARYDPAAADAALSLAEEEARKHTRGIWANGSQPLTSTR